MKKILISGASGFVGSHLSRSLAEAGYEVWQLVRQSKELAQRQLLWSPDLGLAKPELANDFDAFFHLAGRSVAAARWSDHEKQKLRDSRVKATQVLVAQLTQLSMPPKVFIGASAVGYYGNCDQDFVDESRLPGSDFLAKLAFDWERAAKRLDDVDTRVVHARLGIVLDPSGGALAKLIPLFRFALGGKVGSGKQFMPWIALQDAIRGLQFLLTNASAQGAFNLVAPNPVDNLEFTRKLAQALRRPACVPAPAFALRLLLGEMADALLLTSCRAVPRALESAGFQFKYSDLREYFNNEL